MHRALAGDAGGACRHLQGEGCVSALDLDYPPDRLAFMLADAGAPVLLTRAAPAFIAASTEIRARVDDLEPPI